MKKVMIIAPMEANGRYRGGIMTVANTLLENTKKFENYNICLDKFNTYIKQRKAETIGKFDVDNILNMFLIIKGLLKATGSDEIDTLYYNTSIKKALIKDLLVIEVLRFLGRKQKIILHIHFAEIEKILPSQRLIRKWIISVLNKSIDNIVFLSSETKKQFENAGLETCKGKVIYNFCDSGISEPDLINKTNNFLEKKTVDFIFLGSIDRRKGILDLLKVIDELDDMLDIRLHVCGECNDDSVRNEYLSLISKLKNKVIIHGFIKGKDKEELLNNSDCLILPSYGEGFPLVLIEAMSHGCSCITTSVGAVPEFFNNEKNGYMFDAGNVEELKNNIIKIVKSKNKTIEQMKTNYILSKEFSLDNFIDKLQQVL